MKSDSFFQYRCYNDHALIKERAEEFFKQYQAGRKRKLLDKHKQQATRKAFKVALAGMCFGDAFDEQGSFVRISLNKNNYFGHRRLSPVFQPELYLVFNWLIDNGIIVKVSESYFDPSTKKEIPRGYRLADDWLGMAKAPIKLCKEIKVKTSRNRDAEFIELRDEQKICQRLSPNSQKKLSLELLRWYDSELNNHTFKLGNADLPPFYFSLTRIYSKSSYSLGGRFYSPFQSFGSQLRLNLKIDGENVFEVDLSSLHPTLLYRMADKELQHDPYSVEGYPRSIVKMAMQVLLNTTKPFPPAKSLRYYLSKERLRQSNKNESPWKAIDFTHDYCKGLAEAIAIHNQPIVHYFSQGIGLKLQHQDSIFTSCVLHYMMRTSPATVVIPIHDSYIVKQSALRTLLDALSYAEVMISKINNWEMLEPKLKIEFIIINDPDAYKSTLSELSTRIDTTVNIEDVNEQRNVFDLTEGQYEQSYDLDAGI